MLAFFRRTVGSKLVLLLLAALALAFILTGFGSSVNLGALGGSTYAAKVGSKEISPEELTKQVRSAFKGRQQQNPSFTMSNYVQAGAVDKILEDLVSLASLRLFGEDNDVVISRRLVDGQIASMPAFAGASGNFDEDKFRALLQQNEMQEDLFRESLTDSIVERHLLMPVSAIPFVPKGYAMVYASMKLEERSGMAAVIPSTAFIDKTAPSDAELAAFYARNGARYTLPETRVLRYARFDRSRFEGKVGPTEKEIQDYFGQNAQRYASKETRGLTQVIVQDQASAQKIAVAARDGTMAAAAKTAGADVLTVAPLEQGPLGSQSSVAVAKAVFAAKRGDVVGPVKSGLGWHVVRVDAVNITGGKTLDQARPEITAELTKVKVDEAVQDFSDKIDSETADGATFDEVAKANDLTVVETPAFTEDGKAPGQPGFKLDQDMAPIGREIFAMGAEDDATAAVVGDGKFVFFKVGKVTPAAPLPLTGETRSKVTADFITDRAAKAAKKAADAISAKVNRGVALGTALAESGVKLPPPQPVSARYIDVRTAADKAPPPVVALFDTPLRKSRVIPLENGAGWIVVWVDTNKPGDIGKDQAMLDATSGELNELFGNEHAEQFGNAARQSQTIKQNDEAIAAIKTNLTGNEAK